MSHKMALKIAIDLLHVPSQVRRVRSEPLPEGVVTLLRIAAGDSEAERAAAAIAERSRAVVRQAAGFFIEQILFAPNADSYQVLGASPQASASELRQNLGLLLRWLHPDVDPSGERSIFVGRVTAAWNDLKTPERRAAYDQARRNSKDGRKSHQKMARARSWRHDNRRPMTGAPYQSRVGTNARSTYGFLRRALWLLFQTRQY
jgi:DnaJ-domain-containing protein 1